MSQNQLACISVCAFCSVSITNIATPTFSIFLVEILKLVSQLNFAAILLIGFLNFEVGAIMASFQCHFPVNFRFQFLGPFLAGKWAWPPRQRLRVRGLRTRPKSWPTLGFFWFTCYLKIVFPNFQTLVPPLKVKVFVYRSSNLRRLLK